MKNKKECNEKVVAVCSGEHNSGFVDVFNTHQKYNIIYADPPWAYLWGKGKEGGRFSPEKHYPTMSTDEICEMKDTIKKIASEVYPDRDIDIIDPAPAVARHLMEVMAEEGISSGDGFSIELHASGDPTTLKETYDRL